MRLQIENLVRRKNRQTGALTVFTAVMVLVVLTLMIFYAVRVGLFAQRISANEVRHKTAFNAAEAALDQGAEYILANAQLILSNSAGVFPDGVGNIRDGWFAANRWAACDATNRLLANHQCGGDTPMKVGSFYYDDPLTLSGVDSMLATGAVPGFAADVTVRLSANICFVTLDDPNAALCEANPASTGESSTYMIITLLSYGYSDCSNVADVSTCNGLATIAKPLANYKQLAGAPTVPLVSKSTFPPTGTANVVPNPNGGGEGVPISVWINDNPNGHACEQTDNSFLSRGTWNTCELQEWYGVTEVPAGTACSINNCRCQSDADSISYANSSLPGNIPVIGIDIIPDTDFPCDLFETFFNTPRSEYQLIKKAAVEISDCDNLNSSSSGILWITDTGCTLNNTDVGTPTSPAVLISEVSVTMVGQVNIFGVLYIFDGENNDNGASLKGAGRASIYGSLIVDGEIDLFAGTVDVVYAEGVLLQAAGLNGIGAVNGGWRDFGLPELAW